MSDVQNLSAELRSRAGKGAARQTRRDGRVPGVIYGNKQPATLISVAPKELMKELRKRAFQATLFDIELAGKKERVLPRDVQFDPGAIGCCTFGDWPRDGRRTTPALSGFRPFTVRDQTKSPARRRRAYFCIWLPHYFTSRSRCRFP